MRKANLKPACPKMGVGRRCHAAWRQQQHLDPPLDRIFHVDFEFDVHLADSLLNELLINSCSSFTIFISHVCFSHVLKHLTLREDYPNNQLFKIVRLIFAQFFS